MSSHRLFISPVVLERGRKIGRHRSRPLASG
jgi:hypothetical protein